MSFFSRLTDIVTCNLAEILANEKDPVGAVQQIIDEMKLGIAGAERSANTAARNVAQLQEEIDEHSQRAAEWKDRAKAALASNDENAAREALIRKSELDDLIAGLTPELKAAESTRKHLNTTLRALEARMNDAARKQAQLISGKGITQEPAAPEEEAPVTADKSRTREIDDELAALRAEIENAQ